MSKYLPEKEQEILDRYVGQCCERIEKVNLDPVTCDVVKDIVRKQMRRLAAALVEGQDDQS